MNPDGTNPSTNTGAGSAAAGSGAVVPPALDFTSSDTTSLSMADSLASAADNLTSAGMAAKTPDNGSIGLGQIGASDPSATMERPDEPLVPAAPVPGSLGSVTSGPAVTSSDNAAGFGTSTDAAAAGSYGASSAAGGLGTSGSAAANGFGGSASTLGGATSAGTGFGAANNVNSYGAAGGFGATGGASAVPTTAGFGAMPTTNNMGSVATSGVSSMTSAPAGAGAADSAASSATNGASTGTGEPYNPFAKMGAGSAMTGGARGLGASKATQTSSMNVPMGSQPATEKFSSKKLSNAKKPSLVTVILAILAVVSLVMAIVFAVLWQQAEANKKVTYVPPITDDNNVNQTVAMVTCAKDLGMDGADVLAGLTNHSLVAKVNFANDQLSSVAMLNRYTFIDNAAAEASRGYFDGVTDWYNVLAGNLGVAAIAASLEVVDATVNYNVEAVPEQLVGDYIGVFGLAAGEDGSVDGSRSNIQAIYEANGYVCLED